VRRYFISTAISAAEGNPFLRIRWRQGEIGPARVEIVVPQPKAAELYKSCGAKIDKHYRWRQANLDLEKTVQMKEWSFRVNTSLLGIIVVDYWLIYRGAVGESHGVSQGDFYEQLAKALNENKRDGSSLRERWIHHEEGAVGGVSMDRPRRGISAHLTPTKRKRKGKVGEPLPYSLFNNCRECKRSKLRYICSVCNDTDGLICKVFLCHSSTGRSCLEQHVSATDPDLSG
jgi:hypothetical protein